MDVFERHGGFSATAAICVATLFFFLLQRSWIIKVRRCDVRRYAATNSLFDGSCFNFCFGFSLFVDL